MIIYIQQQKTHNAEEVVYHQVMVGGFFILSFVCAAVAIIEDKGR